MKLYFTKTPRIFMRLFSKLTWRFGTDTKNIYLTFDDGPTPEITSFVLSELKKHQAKATFFCIGKNIENHPFIFQQIINDGHTIGNHTYHHLNGWKTSTEKYMTNIKKTTTIINSSLKTQHSKLNTQHLKFKTQNSKLFRPPYGKIKKNQAKKLQKLGYKIIMWDVLSADFDTTITKEKCVENVLKNTKKGSIIVFHDSVKASKNVHYALPKILTYFTQKGYKFTAI